jgi:basic membrane protein A
VSSRSSIITSLVIVIVVFGALGGILFLTTPYEPSKVAVVVMDPAFGDLSRADQALVGMTEFRRDVSVQYFVPGNIPDYAISYGDAPTTLVEVQDLLENLAASGEYSIILAIGEELAPVVQSVAEDYPLQKFGMIGAVLNADNVASATFATEEAAFLAGALAAFLAAEDDYTGVVGILAAEVDDTAVDRMISGFIQGLQHANTTEALGVTLLDTRYVGAVNNSPIAQGLARTMFDDNASVIFAPVRASIDGVIEAARITDLLYPRRPLIIAAEFDLDYLGTADPLIPTAPSYVATSVIPRTDLAIYDILNMTMWDLFPANANFHYDLSNNGVNLTEFLYSTTYISNDITDEIDAYVAEIIAGTIDPTS